jgi:hypothetical protein
MSAPVFPVVQPAPVYGIIPSWQAGRGAARHVALDKVRRVFHAAADTGNRGGARDMPGLRAP